MGIKGLSQFLEQEFKFQKVSLYEFDALAIDGNNICSKLYERVTDWKMGGEYKEFSLIVKSFFDEIQKKDVKPIVVVDGLRDVRKIDESCKRREDLNLQLETLQNDGKPEVQEMGIELHVSAGEGDVLVVAISNNTPKCPVLGSDSDYFMFELQNGYIPFDKLEHHSCSLYHIDEFIAKFCLPDPMMRFLIPAKHGNDFISKTSGYQEHAETLAELPKYKSCEEYLSSHEFLRPKYEAAKKQYYIQSSPSDIIQDHVGKCPDFSVTTSNNSIDTHFCLIRITTTKVNLMSAAVEKISRESVWNCSQYIRQFLYGFLGIPKVEEITRQNDSSKLHKDIVESKCLQPPIALNEAVMLSLSEREDIVLAVLKLNKMPQQYRLEFNMLPPEFKLPIATTFYWYLSSKFANEKLVKALLLCFLNKAEYGLAARKWFSWENLHAFSQWQSVYSDALALNYMVRSPLHATNPGKLFSGIKAFYYTTLDSGDLFSQYSQISPHLRKMFVIVTSRKKKMSKKYSTPVAAASATASATVSFEHSNRFSFLSEKSD